MPSGQRLGGILLLRSVLPDTPRARDRKAKISLGPKKGGRIVELQRLREATAGAEDVPLIY
jgi:hypothetical protein